ncbi:DUF4190 domain-containing protein [Myroides sp. N17-2]|uniref:DUF4190 domain-containing protein n=1 Tax=Myroides sp. N17-2 TaxID=2030799 RepID=UPI000EFA750C|nr:DUF4190 domain-containing protein [Myroides sp. N17-2]
MQNNNYPPPAPTQQTSVLGIISLVFAIIALVVSFIPCFGYFAIFIALVPIIASIVVLVQAKKTGEPKGLAIAGLAIGGVALLIGLFWGILLGGFTSQLQKDLNNHDYYDTTDSIEEPYYQEEEAEDTDVEIFTEDTDTTAQDTNQ